MMFALCFGVLALIRGVERLGDDHPGAGWTFVAGGTGLLLMFVWMLWRRRSVLRREQSD